MMTSFGFCLSNKIKGGRFFFLQIQKNNPNFLC
jgi:hypothetical protein